MGLVISGAALQLDGNQTDSFTMKGGLDKATTLVDLLQGWWKILAIIQIKLHSVMNTAAHIGSNIAYSAQCD